MISVNVKKKTPCPISSPKIKKALKSFLEERGIVSDSEISVAIVDEKEMKIIAKKYLKEFGKPAHNVLSFVDSEVKKFINPPDGKIYLGEIVICYPVLKKEAKKQEKLIDDRAIELIEHGALHLLGIHHN